MAQRKPRVLNFRDLTVYQKAICYQKEIYEAIKAFPHFEDDVLITALRKNVVSITLNIAEGNANFYYNKEHDRYNTAVEKLSSTRAILDLALSLNYISAQQYKELDNLAEEVLRMLIKLMDKIHIKNKRSESAC
ncbi:four helix bundle protein [Alkalihalobacterium bogoriense]|uniref:four helix bundle protein n=1 Tax=Alkalihalobacterium bogoriense TaxID=246272 RepID=UPI00047C02FE|nr:four helix bundle protein [Alkalihalobacterium bogoriense]